MPPVYAGPPRRIGVAFSRERRTLAGFAVATIGRGRGVTAIELRRTRRPRCLGLESKASALARSKAEALDSRRLGCGA